MKWAHVKSWSMRGRRIMWLKDMRIERERREFKQITKLINVEARRGS